AAGWWARAGTTRVSTRSGAAASAWRSRWGKRRDDPTLSYTAAVATVKEILLDAARPPRFPLPLADPTSHGRQPSRGGTYGDRSEARAPQGDAARARRAHGGERCRSRHAPTRDARLLHRDLLHLL